MKRYLSLTLLLAAIQFVVGWAVEFGVFRNVDLRFHSLVAYGLIAPFQAAIVLWIRRDPAIGAVLAAPAVFRHRAALGIALIDLVVLALVLLRFPEAIRLVSGIHALLAALLFIVVARTLPPRHAWIIILTATGLALYGATAFFDWLAFLPGLLGRKGLILRWAAVYIPLFIVTVLVLLRAASALATRALVARGWVEISIALQLVAAVILICNVYFHPYLIEPWKSIERILAYASVTAILLSGYAALSNRGEPDVA